jgi:hypothetical protein
VLYREAEHVGGKGLKHIYYIVFKQGGKVFEAKADDNSWSYDSGQSSKNHCGIIEGHAQGSQVAPPGDCR